MRAHHACHQLCRYGPVEIPRTEIYIPDNNTDPLNLLENVVPASFVSGRRVMCQTPYRPAGTTLDDVWQTLVAMHNGTGMPVVLSSLPPTVNGTRRGGTDAANAATWRLTPAPVTHRYGLATDEAVVAGSGTVVYLEAFDMPGHVLTASAGGAGALTLEPFTGSRQLWHFQPAQGEQSGRVVLQSASEYGKVLAVARAERPAGASAPLLHRGAFASRTARLVLADGDASTPAARFTAAAAPAEYPPLALWTLPDAATPRRRRSSFLLLPLNEIVDEHYSVYWCLLEVPGAPPPAFCL